MVALPELEIFMSLTIWKTYASHFLCFPLKHKQQEYNHPLTWSKKKTVISVIRFASCLLTSSPMLGTESHSFFLKFFLVKWGTEAILKFYIRSKITEYRSPENKTRHNRDKNLGTNKKQIWSKANEGQKPGD